VLCDTLTNRPLRSAHGRLLLVPVTVVYSGALRRVVPKSYFRENRIIAKTHFGVFLIQILLRTNARSDIGYIKKIKIYKKLYIAF
jgi:hypothetical protein